MLHFKKTGLVGIILISVLLYGCVSQGEYDKLQNEKDELQTKYDALADENETMKSELETLKGEIDGLKSEIQQIQNEQNSDGTTVEPSSESNVSDTSNPYEDDINYVKNGYSHMTDELDKLKDAIIDDLRKL